MKLKSFKSLLMEETSKKLFNAFVEDTFNGLWSNVGNNFGNFTTDYSCKGSSSSTIYRIIFFPKEEINQLNKISDLKSKITELLTQENQSHPRFYTKDNYHKIPDHLSFLASIGKKIHGYTDDGAEQTYMGIIISRSCGKNDNVDFSNYDKTNGNDDITKRIETTKPVLAVNDLSFKIVANLEFVNKLGWTIHDIHSHLDIEGNEEEQPTTPEEEEEGIPSEENIKNNLNKGNQ